MSELASQVPVFELPNGAKIPAIGFGSGTKWQWAKKGRDESEKDTLHEDLVSAVKQGLDKGFRHIDTSDAYTTEPEIGEALKRSGLARSEVFVTTKYNPGGSFIKRSADDPYQGLVKSLDRLQLDYVDLYLLHTPFFDPDYCLINLEEAWKFMEKLYKEGKAKNIGISNFDAGFVERILAVAEIKPVVNQIEYHPNLPSQTPGIIELCKKHDILIEAYAPLAPLLGQDKSTPLLELVTELATKHGRSPTQILLRWVYQTGALPLTTTSNAERCVDALETFSFELSPAEVDSISTAGKKTFYRKFFNPVYDKYNDELKKGYQLD